MSTWFGPNVIFAADGINAIKADLLACMTTDATGQPKIDIPAFLALATTRLAAILDPSDPRQWSTPDLLRNVNVRPFLETFQAELGKLNSSNTGGTALDLQPYLTDLRVKSDAVTAYFQRRLNVDLPALLLTDLTTGQLEQGVPVVDDPTKETRFFRTTFVNDWENESAPSDVSEPVEFGFKDTVTITVGAVPSGRNLTYWRAYRSNVGKETAAFEYVPNAANVLGVPIASTTFLDNVPNSKLQEVCPSTIWAEPPTNLRGLVGMANGIHLGFFGRTLCPSESNHPYAYPVEYRITVDHEVVGLCAWEQSVFVGTKGTPYFVTGADAASLTSRKVTSNQACVSARSICATRLGPVYASPDGLCLASPSEVKNLTAELFSREEWQAIKPAELMVQEHEGIVYMWMQDPIAAASAPLLLHLDASDLSTITEVSSRVSQWNDKSPIGRHATQTTPGSRGVRKTDRFASGAIEFAGSEGMSFSSLNLTLGTTIFFVCYWTATNAAYTSLALTGGQIQSGADWAAMTTSGPPSSPTSSGNMGLNDAGAGNASTADNTIPTGKHIMEFVAVANSPASTKLRMDGVDLAITTSGAAWNITVNAIGLQTFYGSGGNQFAEILVYDGVLSPADCATIRALLQVKWGI